MQPARFLFAALTLVGAIDVVSSQAADLSKGEYLARAANCIACHTMSEGVPYTGGLRMATPVGVIYSTNITPDAETGIGRYTLEDFDKAIRKGIAKDGHQLYPAMPYPSYSKISDEDIKSLYDFFLKEVKPVRQKNSAPEIAWPMNMRWPLSIWNAVMTETAPYVANRDFDAEWNRGAYLVQGPGHCGACLALSSTIGRPPICAAMPILALAAGAKLILPLISRLAAAVSAPPLAPCMKWSLIRHNI